jgi:hypothetical protein
MDRIQLAYDLVRWGRVVNTVMNLWVPWKQEIGYGYSRRFLTMDLVKVKSRPNKDQV